MSQAHMDELCDMCGDIGVPDAIAICCRCKISSEHCYCMRIFHQLPPEDWCCEECERNNAIVSPNTSSKLQHDLARPDRLPSNLTQNSMDRKMRIPTGKVKPLSPREVILLSSGAKKSGSPIKHTFCQNTILQKSKSFKADRTQVKFGAVPPKFSSHPFRANPTLGPSKRLKAPRGSTSQINSIARQQSFKELRAIQVPPKEHTRKEHIQKVRSVNYITGVANFRMAQSSVEKAMPEESDVSSPLMDDLAIANSELRTAEPNVARLMNVLSTVDAYVPALDATWKGSYRILDNPKYEGKNDGIQACPPSRVRKNVYELSKILPKILDFELVQRGDLQMNFFQNDCPDGKDVGLYFFPSNSERFENYISLLEHIGSKDLVMRTLLNRVELLVFTSKLLRKNFQRWNGRYFLWGFFHRVKEDRASVPVDMEVDMVAGQIVGTVDIVVPRERLLLPSVDARKDIGIPHGFERAYRSH